MKEFCPGLTTPFSSEPAKIWHWRAGRGGHYPQRHGADPLRPQAAHRQDSEHGRDNGVSQLDIGQRRRCHDGVTTSSLSPWRRWLP